MTGLLARMINGISYLTARMHLSILWLLSNVLHSYASEYRYNALRIAILQLDPKVTVGRLPDFCQGYLRFMVYLSGQHICLVDQALYLDDTYVIPRITQEPDGGWMVGKNYETGRVYVGIEAVVEQIRTYIMLEKI